ncbi:MAG: polyprenyl synthetase family protein, partial [Chloroflexi bacterium]|nr:polyprenyl synthetase family protein [Chloroflexota bacterium]
AINAGDAMFCLSSLNLRELRAHFDDATVVGAMTLLQDATREMIEGQVLDVGYEQVLEVSQDEYLHMIACKTGALLRASIELGALLADAGALVRLRCRRFGETTGRLFQIRDDMLGVWGETGVTGKPVGADIQRKKKSMPIVMALSLAPKSTRQRLLSIYGREALSEADVAEVQDIFRQLEVQSAVQTMAEEAHQQALELADSINFSDEGRAQLKSLVNFLLERDH